MLAVTSSCSSVPMRYSAPLFVLLALTTPTLTSAQGDSIAMAAMARLQPGNSIRVHVIGQGWLNGSVTQNYVDSLVLSSDQHERVVPKVSLDSVLVRHGHAGIGAGVGALVGMLVAANAKCETPPATNLSDAVASIGPQIDCGMKHMMAGLAVGALIGAIIGGATASWEHRVPVEEPRASPAASGRVVRQPPPPLP